MTILPFAEAIPRRRSSWRQTGRSKRRRVGVRYHLNVKHFAPSAQSHDVSPGRECLANP